MEITDHLLKENKTEKITHQLTDKTSGKFVQGQPDTVVVHFTAGRDARSSIATLINPTVKASAHLVIGRDNSITQLVPFDKIAWHAGRSSWDSRSGLNRYSIGIEIDNAGRLDKQGNEYLSWFKKSYPAEEVFEGVHRNEEAASFWHRYTEDQIKITEDIIRLLVGQYGINLILGHEEISPGRKVDPGPAFPLDKIRNDILFSDRQQEDEDEFEGDLGGMPSETMGLVTANKLNVRSGPSTDSIKITKPLPRGSLVKVIERQGNWYKVKIEEQGWVSADWLRVD
ncbi:N-acetylmuramoyl-L-alanine amidase [Fulvivirga sp. M361]|uniref:N-acetylmuramoyl-L-alanine amidase n=1 Tax=Fulvivirga sp. M361 TaxID=2594266 RepID=UPI00117B68E8|nr:N-acetylmuramoyl-L-alanine amidase [Fulvivirga sp. M361]TRX47202.1 N-acetylmuramoyl-L-alanine amidase [Fulvivirga sp. M361]